MVDCNPDPWLPRNYSSQHPCFYVDKVSSVSPPTLTLSLDLSLALAKRMSANMTLVHWGLSFWNAAFAVWASPGWPLWGEEIMERQRKNTRRVSSHSSHPSWGTRYVNEDILDYPIPVEVPDYYSCLSDHRWNNKRNIHLRQAGISDSWNCG